MAKHNELGKLGEKVAVAFLIKKGYTIVAQNWRFQKAEVDIIAQTDDILVAVEVKTRSTNAFGNPQDFINPKKVRLLTSALHQYVVQHELDVSVLFDIIAITKTHDKTDLEHIEDAFYHF